MLFVFFMFLKNWQPSNIFQEAAFINELHAANAATIGRIQKAHQDKAALVEHQQLLEKHSAKRSHDR